MPSAVATLFAGAALQRHGVVPWGERIGRQNSGPGTGVYIVALTDDPDSLDATLATCPVSEAAVGQLLKVRPELTVDGVRPRSSQLAARLAGFWCADEVVLYIGRAGPRPRTRIKVSELSDRVGEYYTTPLGARSPHAGGWPLKTLSNLHELHVHYAYCADDKTAEERMLDHFAQDLSDSTREALHDSTYVMPFANLEDARKRRKQHGIEGARAPRKSARAKAAATTAVSRVTPEAGADGAITEVSAPELARRLGVNPKTLRAWLRAQAAAGNVLVTDHEHYGRWWFTETEARQLAEQYRRRAD